MLSVLKVNDVSFGIDIEKALGVSKISCNQFRCPVNEFVRMKFIVYNNQGNQGFFVNFVKLQNSI